LEGYSADSNDLLMSAVLRAHEPQVWLLAEHLVIHYRFTPSSRQRDRAGAVPIEPD
jgi:hypothetical protein